MVSAIDRSIDRNLTPFCLNVSIDLENQDPEARDSSLLTANNLIALSQSRILTLRSQP